MLYLNLIIVKLVKCVRYYILHSIVVPVTSVMLTTIPTNTSQLVEGTYLYIVCNATIDVEDVTVSFEWYRNNTIISNGDSMYGIASKMYTSTLKIERLSFTRDSNAVYSCLVRLQPVSDRLHILEDSFKSMLTLQVQS